MSPLLSYLCLVEYTIAKLRFQVQMVTIAYYHQERDVQRLLRKSREVQDE